jgi:DNA-binding transcriptional regulator YiaG
MGRQMSERAEFHVMGQPYDGAPLHYTASGLDYVYLLNGFSVESDPDYGRIVTIDAPDDLHRAIGLHVVTQRRALKGAEFRFLRKQMKFTQQELAERFGTDVQTIANYEKGKKIPLISERYMRVTFVLWTIPPDARAAVVKEIAEEVQKKKTKKTLRSNVRRCASYPEIVNQWHQNDACDHFRRVH